MSMMMNALAVMIALLAVGFVLYLCYGLVLWVLLIARLIFQGVCDMLTLKSLRQELRKFVD